MSKENLNQYREDSMNCMKYIGDIGDRKLWKPEKLVIPRHTYLG